MTAGQSDGRVRAYPESPRSVGNSFRSQAGLPSSRQFCRRKTRAPVHRDTRSVAVKFQCSQGFVGKATLKHRRHKTLLLYELLLHQEISLIVYFIAMLLAGVYRV